MDLDNLCHTCGQTFSNYLLRSKHEVAYHSGRLLGCKECPYTAFGQSIECASLVISMSLSGRRPCLILKRPGEGGGAKPRPAWEVSAIRRRLGVMAVRCQASFLLGRLGLLGPGETAAAGRRWQAAEVQRM